MKLITANPNDNSATMVCKTISLVPSSFMGWSILVIWARYAKSNLALSASDNPEPPVPPPRGDLFILILGQENLGPAGGGPMPPGPKRLQSLAQLCSSLIKGRCDTPSQGRNRNNDRHCDQRYQQAILHRGRARLIFEKILDPFHFVLSLIGYWVFPCGFGFSRLTNF
jgi:hypothetical protein